MNRGRRPSALNPAEVTIVCTHRPSQSPNLAALSVQERARAARMSEPHASAWVAARGWIRGVLAAQLELPSPASIPLTTLPSGAPALPADFGMRLSISYTSELVALAYGPVRLGLDIEDVPDRRLDLLGIAAVTATPAELDQLQATASADLPQNFARWWTRKEALAKAIGTGFRTDPRQLHVGAQPVPQAAAPWQVHDLDGLPDNGHLAGAVVIDGPTPYAVSVA